MYNLENNLVLPNWIYSLWKREKLCWRCVCVYVRVHLFFLRTTGRNYSKTPVSRPPLTWMLNDHILGATGWEINRKYRKWSGTKLLFLDYSLLWFANSILICSECICVCTYTLCSTILKGQGEIFELFIHVRSLHHPYVLNSVTLVKVNLKNRTEVNASWLQRVLKSYQNG